MAVALLGGFTIFWLGVALVIGSALSSHGVATVITQGACTSADDGYVCDDYVAFWSGNRRLTALMRGVRANEVNGTPGHRTLAIVYDPGTTDSPSTDDMPGWLPVCHRSGFAFCRMRTDNVGRKMAASPSSRRNLTQTTSRDKGSYWCGRQCCNSAGSLNGILR